MLDLLLYFSMEFSSLLKYKPMVILLQSRISCMRNQVMAVSDSSKLDVPTQCKYAAFFRNIFDHICLFLTNLKPKHIAYRFSENKEQGSRTVLYFPFIAFMVLETICQPLLQINFFQFQYLNQLRKKFFLALESPDVCSSLIKINMRLFIQYLLSLLPWDYISYYLYFSLQLCKYNSNNFLAPLQHYSN